MKYNFSFVYLRNYLKITVLLERNLIILRRIFPSERFAHLLSFCHPFVICLLTVWRMLSFYLPSLCHRFSVFDFCNLGISLTRACWAEFPTCSSHWQGFIWQWVRQGLSALFFLLQGFRKISPDSGKEKFLNSEFAANIMINNWYKI